LAGASIYHRGLDFNYSGGGNTEYGTFRTRYFHLSEINIKNGHSVLESDNIAQMGGSANGKDLGRTSHLHYEIQELQGSKWVSINPTGEKGNKMSNIIDPQKWITSDNKIYQGGTLHEVTVTVPLLPVEQPKRPEIQTP